MKLPGGRNPIIDREKLLGYCLSVEHPRGKFKARVFRSVLGVTAENLELLVAALREAAAENDAEAGPSDRFGDRYVVDFELAGPSGTATVRSAWILRHGESTPRLTSCYVK